MQFDSKFKWSGDIEFDFRTTLQSYNRKIHCYLLYSYYNREIHGNYLYFQQDDICGQLRRGLGEMIDLRTKPSRRLGLMKSL